MSMEIVLSRESYQCLMEHSPEDLFESTAFPTFLDGSGTMPPQVVVSCTRAIAQALLTIARLNCRSAVKDIEIAMREGGQAW